MNKILTLVMLFATLMTFNSCDSDDDLPQQNPTQVNVFCYGDQDAEASFNAAGATRGETSQTANSGILTPVTIYSDGIMLDDTDQLDGSGQIIQLQFYGNSLSGFQSGVYTISDLDSTGNVNAQYALNYDSANQFTTFINLPTGFIKVEPFQTGYAITIDGQDVNGDPFHGIYLGNVPILP